MKKVFYKSERKPTAWFLIFTVIVALAVVFSKVDLSDAGSLKGLLYSFITLGLVVFLFGLVYRSNVKKHLAFCEELNRFIEYGEKTYGEVYDFKVVKHRGGRKRRSHKHRYAKVRGVFNDVDFNFTTPEITFKPEALRSTNVTVYVLDGEYYAYDFDI